MIIHGFDFTEETTLSEWLEHWLYTYKIGSIKDSTRDDYVNTIENHITPTQIHTTEIRHFSAKTGQNRTKIPSENAFNTRKHNIAKCPQTT